MNFDPDGFVLANRPPRFDCLLGTGSLRGPAKLQNEATSRAKWQTRILAPPGAPDGHGRDGGTWRCVHLPHLISTPKCRRSSVASRVLPCISVVPLPFLAGLRRTSRKRRMSEFQLFSE